MPVPSPLPPDPVRSRIMAAVPRAHTKPEILARRAAHRRGLRFRLHVKDLPGTPDIVFPRWRAAVFVHGCFWQRHPGCLKATTPKSNQAFWTAKFEANVARDARHLEDLRGMGWRPVVLWECGLRTLDEAEARIVRAFPHLRDAGS